MQHLDPELTEVAETVRSLLSAGKTPKVIAKSLFKPLRFIKAIMRMYELDAINTGDELWTAEKVELLKTLVATRKYSQRELGTLLGASSPSVSRKIRELGLTYVTPFKANKRDRKNVR